MRATPWEYLGGTGTHVDGTTLPKSFTSASTLRAILPVFPTSVAPCRTWNKWPGNRILLESDSKGLQPEHTIVVFIDSIHLRDTLICITISQSCMTP
jgi:hypothetical protein